LSLRRLTSRLDQLVAIKFMLGPEKPAAVSRFVREARVTVRLKSQHIARIFDVAALEDGTPYIVLEYLEGEDLSDVIHERGPLPVGEAVDAVLQTSEALIEAHALGIIHRDLKPANLFVTRNADGSPCIKVLDFGIAKWAESGTEKLHATGVIGSAPYMAPEQIAAPARVDARTDVWALGATLFELLTGTPPFQHDTAMTMHAMIPTLDPPDLQRPLQAATDRPASASPEASAGLRGVERPPATSLPRIPPRIVSSTAAVRAPASALPTLTRPKELYGERR
jgi:serine/threonine-protein kinase